MGARLCGFGVVRGDGASQLPIEGRRIFEEKVGEFGEKSFVATEPGKCALEIQHGI